MGKLPATMFLNELYKAFSTISKEEQILPTTTKDLQASNLTSIQVVAYRHYPSFFENHGAKAPYLDFIKLKRHISKV